MTILNFKTYARFYKFNIWNFALVLFSPTQDEFLERDLREWGERSLNYNDYPILKFASAIRETRNLE